MTRPITRTRVSPRAVESAPPRARCTYADHSLTFSSLLLVLSFGLVLASLLPAWVSTRHAAAPHADGATRGHQVSEHLASNTDLDGDGDALLQIAPPVPSGFSILLSDFSFAQNHTPF